MGFDLAVFISAGIQDALSPTQLAIAGVYAVMMFFLRHSTKMVQLVSGGLFIAILVVVSVGFLLGFFDLGILSACLDQAFWLFLVLGVIFLVFGFLFLREWRMLLSGSVRKFAPFIPTPSVGMVAGPAVAFFLAATFAFFLNIWPVNYQVLLQGGMAFTSGRFFYSLGALALYAFFRSGPVLFIFLFSILACAKENKVFLRRKISLVSAIASAFFLAVGGSLLFFFYVAATKPWL